MKSPRVAPHGALLLLSVLPMLLALPPGASAHDHEPAAGTRALPSPHAAELGAPARPELLARTRGTGAGTDMAGDMARDMASDMSSDTRLHGTLADNTAINVVSGANVIDAGSFAGMAGIPIVIQNSGANVLIQNATVINLRFK